MDELGEEEVLDDANDQYDNTQDLSEAQLEQYETGTVPTTKEKSDLYNWFWRVVRLHESQRIVKVGNLTKTEIGEHGVSVRDAMNLAELGDIFHHKRFADYWRKRAVVTSASSMSKNGWFMDLSISQKKVRHREKSASSTPSEKWRIFGKKKQENQEQ